MSAKRHEIIASKIDALQCACNYVAKISGNRQIADKIASLASNFDVDSCSYFSIIHGDGVDSSGEFEENIKQYEFAMTAILVDVEIFISNMPAAPDGVRKGSTSCSRGAHWDTNCDEAVRQRMGVEPDQFALMTTMQIWKNLVHSVTFSATIAAPPKSNDYGTCECGTAIQFFGSSRVECDNCGRVKELHGLVFDKSQMYNNGGKCTIKRPYKPKPHVVKHINGLLGKSDTVIPIDVLNKIHELMRASFSNGDRHRTAADMTCDQVRAWCQKVRYKKYIEVPKIRRLVAEMDGITLIPEQFTTDEMYYVTQDAILASEIFEDIQDKPELLTSCGKTEIHNRFFYPYMIYRVIEHHIKDEVRFSRFISAIHFQSGSTLRKNDIIWQMICSRMDGYTYRPSNVYRLKKG